MANLKMNYSDKQNGKVIYNEGIVSGIVVLAVNEVEGAMLLSDKKRGISLFFEKDGVYVDVSVIVRYGYSVPELSYRIQQSIRQNVENMTRFKIAKVDVHIQDVVFDDTTPVGQQMEIDTEATTDSTESEKSQKTEK